MNAISFCVKIVKNFWQLISDCDFYLENLSIQIEKRMQQQKMYILFFWKSWNGGEFTTLVSECFYGLLPTPSSYRMAPSVIDIAIASS